MFPCDVEITDFRLHTADRDKYTWEVELSNGLEIKFDRNFQVIDIDD